MTGQARAQAERDIGLWHVHRTLAPLATDGAFNAPAVVSAHDDLDGSLTLTFIGGTYAATEPCGAYHGTTYADEGDVVAVQLLAIEAAAEPVAPHGCTMGGRTYDVRLPLHRTAGRRVVLDLVSGRVVPTE